MANNNTLWLLLGLYEGKFLIPLDQAVADYFPHLDSKKFIRKVTDGDIRLPIVTAEASQRSAKMIDLRDLAEWLDQQRQAVHDKIAKLHRYGS